MARPALWQHHRVARAQLPVVRARRVRMHAADRDDGRRGDDAGRRLSLAQAVRPQAYSGLFNRQFAGRAGGAAWLGHENRRRSDRAVLAGTFAVQGHAVYGGRGD